MHREILFVLAATAAGAAVAQGDVRRDPTAPNAPVPAVEYRSAFEGYRPFADEKVAPWRDANEAVKGNGGHAAKPSADAKPAVKDAAKPAPSEEHRGHR